MSTSLSGHDQDSGPRSGAIPPGASGTLRVEAVFRDVDERHAHAIAAGMIDRAHELGNRTECECDVDVSVQVVPPEDRGARCDDRDL